MVMGLSGYSSSVVVIVAIGIIFFPSIALGTEHVVGDHHGWATGFDYNIWAAQKVFQVGDTLVFRYEVGQHNVYKVNASAYQNCTVPSNHSEALKSGNDVIVLASPGQKWYLCGVGQHCTTGQRLAISVVPRTISSPPTPASDPPAPAPASSPVQHLLHHFGRSVTTKKLFRRGFHY
ncbi:hypothetical protein PIB30_082084 [Stylosanthes scabra]|uniref:Phytocyanin domain-containing protein n=1 Tax=Stylosanthes scabra TaxID=79078 RepID=A0ABU6QUB0_9FABA|nr:hypothetical protein [Stylosanthes scabra]